VVTLKLIEGYHSFESLRFRLSVELLIVAAIELTGCERVSGRVPAVGVSGSMFSPAAIGAIASD